MILVPSYFSIIFYLTIDDLFAMTTPAVDVLSLTFPPKILRF